MAQSTLIWVALTLLLVSSTLGNSNVPFIMAHKNLKGTNHNTTIGGAARVDGFSGHLKWVRLTVNDWIGFLMS